VSLVGFERQANDARLRVAHPVRHANAGKSRHDVDAAIVGNAARDAFDVVAGLECAKIVAQPLDGLPAVEHNAFGLVVCRLAQRPTAEVTGFFPVTPQPSYPRRWPPMFTE
jgi:hypothetical protein